MVIHIESFVKADSGARQGSAIEHLQKFLSLGTLTADIPLPVTPVVVN